MEKQTFKFTLKGIDDSEDNKFYELEGIASDNSLDRIEDIVVSGAVTQSVSKFGIPKFLHQHDMRQPIGVFKEIFQMGDDTMIKAQLPKGHQVIDQIIDLVKMGAYGGFSIGFNIIDSEWKDNVRIIKEIEVLEISLVTIPCNSNAVVTGVKSDQQKQEVKKMIDEIKDLSGVEVLLKEKGGFSANESKSIISKISKLKTAERDAEQKAAEETEQAARDAEQTELVKGLNDLNTIGKDFITKQKED